MASLVMKVKYGETLRRFNVAINGEQRLVLSMEDLRLKIRSLFNFPSDADFRLTYEDEDDDLVTLVNDDDLHDVVRQGLDPVRIVVHLNTDQSIQSSSTLASGSAAPSIPSLQAVQPNVTEAIKTVQETLGHVILNLRSSTPNSQQNLNPDVAKIMKSVQEPLTQAFTKLSSDMSSKAASTSPILAELFDGLSKIGQSCVNAALSNSCASSVSSHDGVGNDSNTKSEGRKLKGSTDEGTKNNDSDTANATQPSPKVTQAASPCPFSLDKGKNVSGESSSKKKSSSCGMKKSKKDATSQKKGPGLSDGFLRTTPMNFSEIESHDERVSKTNGTGSSDGLLKAAPVNASDMKSLRDELHEKIRGYKTHRAPLIQNAAPPFSGSPIKHDSFLKHLPNTSSYIFHKGVRCDGCGALPITGPRFKSKVKFDYDLCGICFSRTGNDVDYTRIDFPVLQGHSWSPDPKSLQQQMMLQQQQQQQMIHHRNRMMQQQLMMKLHPSGQPRSRLDSRFIMDVNVMDGTAMAPRTPFTKIWRMRNNGTLPWNHGLQLVWIGGDRFSRSESIEIQIPSAGADVGLELDIAVDFIAPDLPGRYISYWRMAEASNKNLKFFGQRVWVQIQVDPSVDLTRESSPMLNLNLPPDSIETTFPEVVDVKTEPGCIVEVGESSAPSILKYDHKIEIENPNFPTNDDLLVAGDLVYPTLASSVPPPAVSVERPVSSVPPPAVSVERTVSLAGPSFISYSHGGSDTYLLPVASAPLPPYPELREVSPDASHVKNDVSNHEQEYEESNIEEILLKELAQMGFNQGEMNKEVLRKNEYDLERCVDDLCDVSEWDPILEELKEMGFEDKETNKKLLVKNNGSITRVVMDLIAKKED